MLFEEIVERDPAVGEIEEMIEILIDLKMARINETLVGTEKDEQLSELQQNFYKICQLLEQPPNFDDDFRKRLKAPY